MADIHPALWSVMTIAIFMLGYIFGKVNGVVGKFIVKLIKNIWDKIRNKDRWLELKPPYNK